MAIEKKRKAEDAAADPDSLLDHHLESEVLSRPHVPPDLLSRETVTMLGTMVSGCSNCLPNRNAALKAFTKDQKHVRRFKAARDAFQERRDAAARRAAGFLKLHEAAIAKEFQEVEPDEVQSSTSPKKRATRQAKGKQRSDTSQQSALVRERAQEELQSLIADGPNAKWAVGPTLDLDDIRALLQCGPAVPGGEHSGYHMDHSTGRNTGLDSDTAATPSSTGPLVDSDRPHNVPPIPDLAPDAIPQLMLLQTVAGPARDPIQTYRKHTPPIPSHHINPIDEESSSEGSGEQDVVHDADIESDPAENEDDDLLAVDGQGDAGNPIQISSRSPSHISVSSDSLGNAADILEVNESSESDEIAGPGYTLGTRHSDNDSSDEDSISIQGGNHLFHDKVDSHNRAGPSVIGDLDLGSDEVASGHDSESAGDVGGTAICDDDSIAGDAVITEHHSGSAEAASGHHFDTPARSATLQGFDCDDDDMLAGPEDLLGIVDDEDQSEDDDGDMLAGPEDVLGIIDGEYQSEDEEDIDDVNNEGLGQRVSAAMFLRELVNQRTAGPSTQPARDHPYTAADFEDVPDVWFP